MDISKLTYLTLIEDTREQTPLDFSRFEPFVRVERGTLRSGDYSVKGHEDEFAIERKSLADLIGTITQGHERFERELQRLESFRYAAIVVEASEMNLRAGKYRSMLPAKSAVGMIRAFEVRYKVPFHFAGSRYAAAQTIFELAYYFKREMLKPLPPMPREIKEPEPKPKKRRASKSASTAKRDEFVGKISQERHPSIRTNDTLRPHES